MVSLIEEEYESFTRDGLWRRVFDRIQNEAAVMYNFSSKQARSAENRDRNRYRDVSPYDDFRVKLEGCENNYINASRVEVPLVGRTYILTQGPLANTSGHFWLMVWQQNSTGVLMLNRVIEDGRLKCHLYFPMGADYGGDDSITFPEVDLRVEYIKTEDRDYFMIRTLRLVNLQTEEAKFVLQFHYIDWPDFGIPKNSASFLSFLAAVRQSGVICSPHAEDKQTGPPVIHCSAGIGRSGTFCLVDSALVQVERTRSLLSLDLRSMLIDMRKFRCGLIQRPEQLQFSYMAILDGAHAILTPSLKPPSPLSSGETSELSDEDDMSEVAEDVSEPDEEEEEEVTETDEKMKNLLEKENVDEMDDGPDPPVRTSSLTADEDSQTDSSASQAPPKPMRASIPGQVNSHPTASTSDIPEPPTRTTSLHKSASLDEQPPPVPPRPPSAFDRQKSAPGAVRRPSEENKPIDESVEEEVGLDPANRGPIGMYNNAIKRRREETREENNRKLRERVETMKAKQRASEAAKDAPYIYKHWKFLVGAGVALLIATGWGFFEPTIPSIFSYLR